MRPSAAASFPPCERRSSSFADWKATSALRERRAATWSSAADGVEPREEILAERGVRQPRLVLDRQSGELCHHGFGAEAGAFTDGRFGARRGENLRVPDAARGGARFEDEAVDGLRGVRQFLREALHRAGDIAAGGGLDQAQPFPVPDDPDFLPRRAEADLHFRTDRPEVRVRPEFLHELVADHRAVVTAAPEAQALAHHHDRTGKCGHASLPSARQQIISKMRLSAPLLFIILFFP